MDISHFMDPFISGWVFGLFHILATVNSAAVNIHVQVFDHLSLLLLDICLKVGLLGHMVVLFNLLKMFSFYQRLS